jgi:hypothetical protein
MRSHQRFAFHILAWLPPVALALALGASCAAPAPEPRAIPARQFVIAKFNRDPLERSYLQIADGLPNQAIRRFRAVLASDTDPHYLPYNNALRGAFLADLYAKNDRGAAADVSASIVQAGVAPAGDAAAARGRWKDAWSGYLRDSVPADSACTDATVAQGIRLARAGRYTEARSAWHQPIRDVGTCDVAVDLFRFANGTDTKSALIGLSYLEQGRWRQAEAALITAVMYNRTTSGYTKLFPGNIIAMEMLFAFRAHFARGEGRYRWPDLTPWD